MKDEELLGIAAMTVVLVYLAVFLVTWKGFRHWRRESIHRFGFVSVLIALLTFGLVYLHVLSAIFTGTGWLDGHAILGFLVAAGTGLLANQGLLVVAVRRRYLEALRDREAPSNPDGNEDDARRAGW